MFKIVSLLLYVIIILLICNSSLVNSNVIDINGNIDIEQYTESYYLDLLKKFNEAFNSHDSNALISMMTDDCVFSQSMGSMGISTGTQIIGPNDIKVAFDTTFNNFPDAKWIPRDNDFVAKGNENGYWYGLSPWIFQGTRKSDGAIFNTNGVDVFTMKNGKIYLKDAFRKDVPPSTQ